MGLIINAALLKPGVTARVGRFWVGGSGAWNTINTANWSTASGGSGGASIPTSTTNVYFDSNSGSGIINKISTGNCKDFDCTGYTGTFTGVGSINITGSLTWGSAMFLSYAGTLTLSGSGAKTIKTNGKSLNAGMNFNGAGSTWTLQDALVLTRQINVIVGSIIANSNNISATGIVKFTNGGLNIDGVTVNCSSAWEANAGAGAFSGIGSTISLNSGTFFNTSGAISYSEVHINPVSAVAVTGAINCNILRIGNTAGYASVSFDTSFTVGTLMQVLGFNSTDKRLLLSSSVLNGAPIAITCGTTNPILSNVDLAGITASGFTPWTGSSVGDAQGNSGVTFTTPVTRYLVAPSGGDYMDASLWSTSSGGSGGVSPPLPQDTAIFDVNSFPSPALTLNLQSYRVPSIDFTNVFNNPTVQGSLPTFLGDYIVPPGVSSIISTAFISGYGITQTLSIPNAISSGEIAFQMRNSGVANVVSDLYFPNNGLYINSGVVDQGVNNFTFGFLINGITGSSPTWNKTTGDMTISEIYGITGNVVTLDPTLTFNNSGFGSFIIENNGLLKGMTFNSHTINNLYLKVSAPGSTFNFDSGNTFTDVKIDAGCEVDWPSTSNINTLNAIGSIGNNIVMDGIAGASWAIVSLSGTTVNADYLTLSNSTASGATFNATNSIDGGGNTGWNITSFIPSDLANLNIWLDANDPANDGSHPADGSSFTSWIDRSLSSMDFTSPSPLFNACAFYTNQLNGLPGINFDGSNSWMGSIDSINTIEYTMFVVGKTNQIVNETYFASNGSTGTNGAALIAVSGSVLNGMQYGGVANVEDGTPDTLPHIFNGMWDGANTTFYIDNVSQALTNDTVAPITPSGQSWLGTDHTFLTSFGGQINEVVFYSRALSTGERNQVYAYLKNKWGL